MSRQYLTLREKEIVEQLLKGKSNAEIAEKLNSTAQSVSTRLHIIYVKFGLVNKKNVRNEFKKIGRKYL